MKRIIPGVILILTVSLLSAQIPSGDDILRRLDANTVSDSRISVGKMIIHGRRSSRTVEAKSWVRGTEQSFTEYLAPARERGTKMLKLDDQLWTYSPSTDRTILIAGHMLRQSVMGSDLSYEDFMEEPLLHRLYSAKVVGEDTVLDRSCWVLDLKAVKDDVSYASRKIWVDKERDLALKEERFAKGGKLLKTTEVKSVKRIQNRWVADLVIFKDALKQGRGTEFTLDSIDFEANIPETIFTKASLRK